MNFKPEHSNDKNLKQKIPKNNKVRKNYKKTDKKVIDEKDFQFKYGSLKVVDKIKKQNPYTEELTRQCNNKYKDVPKHQLRFVPLISPEFNLDYLVFKNKNDQIQFIEIDGNRSNPYYIQNYAYDNQGCTPELWFLDKEHREYMLKNMFSDKGYKLANFDWNSLNPKAGYYLCYYRHVGQNKWVYNFDIFELNEYGHWFNLIDERAYDVRNIMSFIFLEEL